VGERDGEGEGIRLQKILADAGVASRRRSEDLIQAGRVKVNGRPAYLGQRAVVGRDRIELDGVPVHTPGERHYYAVNKPAGVVTTSKDPQGRTTVIDLLGVPERVFTVGRLDVDTEGLIIVTDDGELAQRLTHPSFALSKTYVAEVVGVVKQQTLRRLVKSGIDIDGGRPAVADSAQILDVAPGKGARTVVEIAVHEGRNRVVRKMLERSGHPVLRLARTGVGPLRLGRLATGTYRKLTPGEVTALYKASERHIAGVGEEDGAEDFTD
jgi:pseudouridine synthase